MKIETLKRLLAEATPGEWEMERYVVDGDGREVGSMAPGPVFERRRIVGNYTAVAEVVAGRDAALIAAMHASLPALLAVVEAARTLCKARDALVATSPLAGVDLERIDPDELAERCAQYAGHMDLAKAAWSDLRAALAEVEK